MCPSVRRNTNLPLCVRQPRDINSFGAREDCILVIGHGGSITIVSNSPIGASGTSIPLIVSFEPLSGSFEPSLHFPAEICRSYDGAA